MNNTLYDLEKLYIDASNVSDWARLNKPDSDLIYRSGTDEQIKALTAIPDICNGITGTKIAGSHRSKSVVLPVTMFKFTHGFAFMRDNFYDIKLSIVSKYKLTLSYDVIHTLVSEEWYAEERKKCLEWHSTSKDSSLPGYMDQYNSDEWYPKWSSGSIVRADGKIYRAQSVSDCYCEGINELGLPDDVFHIFENNRDMFTISIGSYSRTAYIFDLINAAMVREHYKEAERNRK